MRPQLALLFTAVLGAAGTRIVERQQDEDNSTSVANTETESSSVTSAPPAESSTSSADDNQDSDTTVFRTTTVDGDADTVTRETTIDRTSTRTQTVTSTVFETTTVTEEDAETATSTVRETSTVFERRRRALDQPPRTAAPDASVPAWAPVPTVTYDYEDLRLRDNSFDKRDTVTVIRTVTGDGDGETTVFETATRVVFTTVEEVETTTSVITETEQVNARTTVTITQTLTVTSTAVSTGQVQTSTSPPSQDNNNNNNDGSSNDDGGLSTGAQIGIGVGVGVGGLLILGAIAWWFLRRRRASKPDHDDLIGASEVPVGPSGGHSSPGAGGISPGMSEHATAAAFLAPNRTATNKPNYTQEGYRGTAMGDGRSGYAKPAPYGAAYANMGGTNSTSPGTAYSQPTNRSSTLVGDQLPPHPSPPHSAELGQDGAAARWADPNASEIDSRAVTHQHTGPVYEMPGQNYR